MDKNKQLLVITDDKDLRKILVFCFDGWGYEVFFQSADRLSIEHISKLSPSVIVFDLQEATKERLRFCDMLKRDFSTAYIPVITLIDKADLREHLLELKEGVDDYLIKPPDPRDLRIRIDMAIKRFQHSFYANPLTGLPGGIVIEEGLNDRLNKKMPFVVGHIDIDNFKSFNDKYGYVKGDRIIMQTAYMLSVTIRNWGNEEDMVGHIGGDDFVFITTPDKYKTICQNFICMFDTIMPFHYSAEDRKNGYIVAKDRSKKLKKIPIMSVTLALVMKTNDTEFNTLIQLNERIAEVKQYLKKINGSKYMADRRIASIDENLTLQVFSNDRSVIESYRPLGEILIGRDIITKDELDQALRKHWRRGVCLGEVLKDMGYITQDALDDALVFQEDGL